MSLQAPYFRLSRPFETGGWAQSPINSYVMDERYAPDRVNLVRAYHLLERDLISLFDYVEPSDANVNCFSHQIYALLLRASTEFEASARAILKANSYEKSGNWNIIDFFKINKATRLHEYSVSVPIWQGQQGRFKPFENWAVDHSLSWYQNYNLSKHDRFTNFSSASLESAMHAVGAVFCILFAQFDILVFNPYQPPSIWEQSDTTGVWSQESCMLSIEPPTGWSTSERYSFHWGALKTQENPYQAYPF